MMGWYNGGPGWGGWIVMILVMLAFWALVIFAVVAVFRGVGKGGAPVERSTSRDPLDVLGERFARGEIEADEYEARAQVLRGARPDATRKAGSRRQRA